MRNIPDFSWKWLTAKHWTTKANDDGKNPWFYYLWKQCHFAWIISHFMWFTYGICLSLCAVCWLLMFILFTFAFNFIQCSQLYDVRCVYSDLSVRRLLSHPHSDKHLRIDCYLLLDLITIYRIPNNTCSSVEGFGKKNNKPKKTERRKTQI